MLRRVEGEDVDVVFEMLQQLVELFLAAVAICIDLHLRGDAFGHPRLNVSQIHPLLLVVHSHSVQNRKALLHNVVQ